MSTDHEIRKLSLSRESREDPKSKSANSQDNKAVESAALIIEDVTQGIPHDIPSSSSVVLYVEDEVADECTTPRDVEVENSTQDSDSEVK